MMEEGHFFSALAFGYPSFDFVDRWFKGGGSLRYTNSVKLCVTLW